MDAALERHCTMMVSMARGLAASLPDAAAAYREITQGCAQGMEVDRCSIWRFEGKARILRLIDLYEARNDAHMTGTILNVVDYPHYFREMWEGRVVDAEDAVQDDRTSEFAEGYLKPLGIASMLDLPLRTSKGLLGVICLEHCRPRAWSRLDVHSGAFIASMALLVMEAIEPRSA